MLRVRNKRDGRPTLMQGYGQQLGSIVRRRRTEAALLAAKRDAERAAELARIAMFNAEAGSRAKTEFLANMSHELRTPLNAIIGFSDMIRSQVLGQDRLGKYQEYAEDINHAGAHLLRLINDILDIAKIEAGQLNLHEDLVDVARLLRSSLTIAGQQAQAKQLRIAVDIRDDLPPILLDELKFSQVIINLLSNAVKFTPEQGAITVRAWVDAEQRFTVAIEDTGIGIAPEDIAKAMQPFQQIDSDLNRRYEGTGLGLPLSKALIELHGGSLTLDSAIGRGTIVTVRFPADRVHRSSTDREGSVSSAMRIVR